MEIGLSILLFSITVQLFVASQAISTVADRLKELDASVAGGLDAIQHWLNK